MSYIWNSNHNRTHYPSCRAVTSMMKEEHKIPVDEPRGHSCGWCSPGAGQTTLQENHDNRIEICTDPEIRQIFKKAGCLNGCGNLGDIKMIRDDEDGVPVAGQPGKWWPYLECYECGYQTAFWKALNKINSQNQEPAQIMGDDY